MPERLKANYNYIMNREFDLEDILDEIEDLADKDNMEPLGD